MREMKRSCFRNRKTEKLSVYQEDEIWAKRERKEMLKEMLENIAVSVVVSVVVSLATHFAILALKHYLGIGIG